MCQKHRRKPVSEVWQGPTLVGVVEYEIRVPGELDDSWSEWYNELTVLVEKTGDAAPVTILTGTFDQAALQGLLRRLYSLGLPLISVRWLEHGSNDRR
jgi:hypothetical protein